MAQDVVLSQGECTIYKSARRLDICCLASQAMMPSATQPSLCRDSRASRLVILLNWALVVKTASKIASSCKDFFLKDETSHIFYFHTSLQLSIIFYTSSWIMHHFNDWINTMHNKFPSPPGNCPLEQLPNELLFKILDFLDSQSSPSVAGMREWFMFNDIPCK